jgi:hypothetical protein
MAALRRRRSRRGRVKREPLLTSFPASLRDVIGYAFLRGHSRLTLYDRDPGQGKELTYHHKTEIEYADYYATYSEGGIIIGAPECNKFTFLKQKGSASRYGPFGGFRICVFAKLGPFCSFFEGPVTVSFEADRRSREAALSQHLSPSIQHIVSQYLGGGSGVWIMQLGDATWTHDPSDPLNAYYAADDLDEGY